MIKAADGTAFTGSVTCYYTLDGGTQTIGSVGSGVCTHEGNGFHTYTPTAGETNGDHVAYTFIGTGAIPATVQTYPTFPQTGDNFARLGAPAGASIAADLLVIDNFVDGLESTIGAAGAGLTAIPPVTLANNVTHGGTSALLSISQLLITASDGNPNILLTGSGAADGLSFTRSGAGGVFDTEFAAALQQEAADALTAYDPPTNAEMVAAIDAVPTAAENATAVLTTQMTESYRADGAAPTLAQGICETLAHLGESSIASTTKTIKQFDGTTTAETFTLNDATTPTSITRAT